jgi:hypothetical protein
MCGQTWLLVIESVLYHDQGGREDELELAISGMPAGIATLRWRKRRIRGGLPSCTKLNLTSCGPHDNVEMTSIPFSVDNVWV